MCSLVYCVLIFLTVQLFPAQSETRSLDVKEVLHQCQNNINSSIELDRNDKWLISNWTSEFQVKQVNITSHYRLEMTKHREHSFKRVKLNTKWKECLRLHNIEIRKSKTSYYEAEEKCLKVANSGDKEKRRTVSQVEKEIKKWRKSYKYLSNLCETNNPDDANAAESCLAQYENTLMTQERGNNTVVTDVSFKSDYCILKKFAEPLVDVRNIKIVARAFPTGSTKNMSTDVTAFHRLQIKNDNYDATFERLIILKLDAMSELLQQMNSCLSDLEDCLRGCLSQHLNSIRAVMEALGQCYSRNKESV